MKNEISDYSSIILKFLIYNINFRMLMPNINELGYDRFTALNFRTEYNNNVLHIKCCTLIKENYTSKSICSAIKSSEEEKKILLKEKNFNGWTPFFTAVFYKNNDIIAKFIEINNGYETEKDYFGNDCSFYEPRRKNKTPSK